MEKYFEKESIEEISGELYDSLKKAEEIASLSFDVKTTSSLEKTYYNEFDQKKFIFDINSYSRKLNSKKIKIKNLSKGEVSEIKMLLKSYDERLEESKNKDKEFYEKLQDCALSYRNVKHAIEKVMALESSGHKPVYTIGPLIHNKQATQMLEMKDIRAIDSPQQATNKQGVLVIRAHGITPDFQKEIESYGMTVVDATCPLVKHAQNIIAKFAAQSYHTIIVGDAQHAEVIGLMGYAQNNCHVVSTLEQARQLPHFEKANVVSQTTQKESMFYEIANEIKQHANTCQISNTICQPTKDRQKETIEQAQNADFVIVVGGKHSANTARLALLCKGLCAHVQHVETEEELDSTLVKHAQKIFITAGASTPSWVIDRVVLRVKQLRGVHPQKESV